MRFLPRGSSPDPVVTWREALRFLEGEPKSTNQALAREVLQRELDRVDGAKEAIDTKALAIPVAVGAIGGLTTGHIDLHAGSPWYVAALLAVTAASAFAAVLLSVYALWARSYSLGPHPKDLVSHADLDETRYLQRTLIELGVAVILTVQVVNLKGNRLNLAFLSSGVAVISLLILLLVGGKP